MNGRKKKKTGGMEKLSRVRSAQEYVGWVCTRGVNKLKEQRTTGREEKKQEMGKPERRGSVRDVWEGKGRIIDSVLWTKEEERERFFFFRDL